MLRTGYADKHFAESADPGLSETQPQETQLMDMYLKCAIGFVVGCFLAYAWERINNRNTPSNPTT